MRYRHCYTGLARTVCERLRTAAEVSRLLHKAPFPSTPAEPSRAQPQLTSQPCGFGVVVVVVVVVVVLLLLPLLVVVVVVVLSLVVGWLLLLLLVVVAKVVVVAKTC